jgi:CBS domain-containing protein
MNVKIDELMKHDVHTVPTSAVVGDVRDVMLEHAIHALPVVDDEGHPVGIVTSSDLVEEHAPQLGVVEVMSDKVFTVPRYDDVHIAARIMRNHHLHHVVVTEDHRVVGMVSSLDLLALVEDHRFVMKNGPTESTRKGSKRT